MANSYIELETLYENDILNKNPSFMMIIIYLLMILLYLKVILLKNLIFYVQNVRVFQW